MCCGTAIMSTSSKVVSPPHNCLLPAEQDPVSNETVPTGAMPYISVMLRPASATLLSNHRLGRPCCSFSSRKLVQHQVAPCKTAGLVQQQASSGHQRHQFNAFTSHAGSSDQAGPSNNAQQQSNWQKPFEAKPWFSKHFCQDGRYRNGVPWNAFWIELYATARRCEKPFDKGIVSLLGRFAASGGHFNEHNCSFKDNPATKTRKSPGKRLVSPDAVCSAAGQSLNEVCWGFVDHKLAQAAQQQVFKDNLWSKVLPLKRDYITKAEFDAAVDKFSPDSGSLADLIESIMLNAPGSHADTTVRMRDQVFLNHTGSDEEAYRSVSLTSHLFHRLRYQNYVAFYDTASNEGTELEWRRKIDSCVCSSKVVVVLLSPGYFSRYWCMHELDLALNAGPQPDRRVIITVLLGVDHEWIKQIATYRQAWKGFNQVSSLADADQAQLLDQWEANLRKLESWSAPKAERIGKNWEEKRVVPKVVPAIQNYIEPVLSWQQDLPLQPERHTVHSVLPKPNIRNEAAFKQLADSIEKACKKQAIAWHQAASATGADGAIGGGDGTPDSQQGSSSTDDLAPPVLQLIGLAGMGKSTLALQLAKHYEDTVGCFSGNVHFLPVPPRPAQADDTSVLKSAVMQVQRDLLHQLQPVIEVSRLSSASSPEALHFELARAYATAPLQQATHLLVLDGVWDKAFIKYLWCPTMRGVILITSRHSIWDTAMLGVAADSTFNLQADADSKKAAEHLMIKVVGEVHKHITEEQQDIIDKFLSKCDGNMFATALMAAALSARIEPPVLESWQEVLEQFPERLEESDKPLLFIKAAVDTLYKADMDRRAALQAFDMLRHLKPQLPLPQPLLRLLWSALHPSSSTANVPMMLDHLWRASLLCRQQEATGLAYYTHDVVAYFLATQPPATTLPTSTQSAASCPTRLNKLAVFLLGYGSATSVIWAQKHLGLAPEDGQPITFVGPLNNVLLNPDTAFEREPAGCLNTFLGDLYYQDGQYGKAETFYRSASEAREKYSIKNPEDRDSQCMLATSLSNLAQALQALGNLPAAEPFFNRALEVTEKVMGPWDRQTANALYDLGGLLQAQGKLAEAELVCKRDLAISEVVLDPRHPDLATSLQNLGKLLQARGRLTEAETLYKRDLAISKEVLGPNSLDTAISMYSLATVLQAQGKLTDAEPLYRREMAISKVLGPKHPDRAFSLNSLGGLLLAQGRLPDAESMLTEALTIRKEVLPSKHPLIATSLSSLAGLRQAQGRLPEAESMLTEALTIRQEVLPPSHPDIAASHSSLGGLLQAQGRLDDAEISYRHALDMRMEVLGLEHPDTATSRSDLADLLPKRALGIRQEWQQQEEKQRQRQQQQLEQRQQQLEQWRQQKPQSEKQQSRRLQKRKK